MVSKNDKVFRLVLKKCLFKLKEKFGKQSAIFFRDSQVNVFQPIKRRGWSLSEFFSFSVAVELHD